MKKILLISLLALCSCTHVANTLNPFYEEPSETALMGELNDDALNPTSGKSQTAREALEQMGSYQSANFPQPVNPVMQPAVVRVMWVPDHLNTHGDLVPSHYYYLKVLHDRWAVTDAFELESQIKGSNNSSNIPFVYGEK